MKSSIWQNTVLAWFPSWVIFVFSPIRLFINNVDDFGADYTILVPFLALSALWFLFSLLFNRSQTRKKEIVVAYLFYAAIYFLLADALTPLPEILINQSVETTMPEPLGAVVFDLVLFISFIIITPYIPFAKAKRLFFIVVIVFIGSETGLTFLKLTGAPGAGSQRKTHLVLGLPQEAATTGNIYQFVLDGFSGVDVADLLEEMNVVESFSGFTYFENNRSNYLNTRMSVPSFLTGTTHNSEDLCTWRRFITEGGVGSILNRREYRNSYYGLSEFAHEEVAFVVTPSDVEISLDLMHFIQLGDILSLRVIPQIWHQEMFRDNRGPFSRVSGTMLHNFWSRMKYIWIRVLNRMVKDEKGRAVVGNYVYAHVQLPHAPFELDEWCNPILWESDRALELSERTLIGTINQSRCAVRKMVEFLDVLREEGKYKESLIIIQSDHGTKIFADDKMNGRQKSAGERDEIPPEMNIVSRISRSLLIIKPFGRETERFEVSDRLTQLLDIPATIMSELGEADKFEEGISVFSDDFPDDRRILIFSGFDNVNCTPYVKKKHITINRYSYSKENGTEFVGTEEMEQ